MGDPTDKYEEAAEYLRKNPREIWDAWQFCSTHRAGCLFEHTPDVMGQWSPEFSLLTYEQRDRIRKDLRLPNGGDIRVEHLATLCGAAAPDRQGVDAWVTR